MPVTRMLVNTGNPLITPDGELYANKPVTFQLVKADTQRPVSLFDAINGEFVVGELISVDTNNYGILSQELWPNTRGGEATYYLMSMPESTAKPFLIRVTEGAGDMLLVDAKAGVLPVPPAQTLTLFEALLASISAQVAALRTDLIVVRDTGGEALVEDILAANDPDAIPMIIMKDKSDLTEGTLVITPASGTIDGESTYTIYNAKEFLRITPHAASNSWYVTGR